MGVTVTRSQKKKKRAGSQNKRIKKKNVVIAWWRISKQTHYFPTRTRASRNTPDVLMGCCESTPEVPDEIIPDPVVRKCTSARHDGAAPVISSLNFCNSLRIKKLNNVIFSFNFPNSAFLCVDDGFLITRERASGWMTMTLPTGTLPLRRQELLHVQQGERLATGALVILHQVTASCRELFFFFR